MNKHVLPPGRRAGAVSFLAASALVLGLAPAGARVTEIAGNARTSQSPTFARKTFRAGGTHGWARGAAVWGSPAGWGDTGRVRGPPGGRWRNRTSPRRRARRRRSR